MTKNIRISLLIASIFFIGCSNSTQIHIIKSNKKMFLLNEDISLNKTVHLPKSHITVTFKKGRYVSYAKDNEGTYYKGPDYCYNWIPSNKSLYPITAHCGIYIFNDKLKPYKAYHYVNSIRRISKNKMLTNVLENAYGVHAPIITMFDPEIVFVKKPNLITSDKIHWIKK